MNSARFRSILMPGGFALVLLLSAFMMVVFSACKTNNPVEPGSPAIDGSWHVMTANGTDISANEFWWTFNKGQSTFWQGANDCSATINYSVTKDKIYTTTVKDECGDGEPGEKDTLNYTITGDQMTIKQGTDVMVLKRSPNGIPPMLLGKWNVQTVDGEGPQPGFSMTIQFSSFQMLVEKSNGNEGCQTMFTYTKNGASKIDVSTLFDECSGLEPGTTDTITWTIANGKLTLVFGDGTTIVAKK